MKFKYNPTYFIIACLLLLIEIGIAKFIKTGFIRHTFGDFLVVILLFYIIKAFFNISNLKIGIGVLLFSYLIETLQATNFLKIIGLQHNKLANIIIGNTFSIQDLVAYTLGIISILFIEIMIQKRKFTF